ncbi:MAG: hypothetical protein LBH19_00520 [Dysgonamonadaceae bacterium]|jgi:hypothetical protein|nr:hypothetical protein [Dysgonamonadaceae bacterium]
MQKTIFFLLTFVISNQVLTLSLPPLIGNDRVSEQNAEAPAQRFGNEMHNSFNHKMMKSLIIPYVEDLDTADMEEAVRYFNRNKASCLIDQANWPDRFPYQPECRFQIARSAGSLFIHYEVNEAYVKAVYGNDNESVWKDSCVEFFCRLPEQSGYFNFEFNCIGTCLAARREGRTLNTERFSSEQFKQIKRYASLGNRPFDERPSDGPWTLTVEIPFQLIGIHEGSLPAMIKGNFYKCADGTTRPHYLSWSPIATPQPDFHRPEYFGDLLLE